MRTPPVNNKKNQQYLAEQSDAFHAEYPKPYPLKEFEARTLKQPDTIAVVSGEEHVTNQELNRRANQLCRYLQKKGIGPEKIVGVCLDRSFDLVVGILGVLKAGGAVLPLEPSYPRKRIIFMLGDGKPSVILTHQHLQELVSHESVSSIYLDSSWDVIAREGSENLNCTLRDGNLLVVFYTSGSTGNPKGVLEVHRECSQLETTESHNNASNSRALVFGLEDRVLVKCPISFAPSFWEFLEPLSTGAVLVIARPGGEQDFHYLVRLILEQQITMMHFVPSALRMFLDQPQAKMCMSLQHVVCSGEMLPEEVRQKFFLCLNANLHLYYAATEAPAATLLDLHRDNCEQPLTFSCGSITKVYVLDPEYQQVPVSIHGEVYIEAKGKIRGYLGKPALTAETFVANPLSSIPGSRLYKTGDLACYLKDGSIKLLGRRDFQVKLRGVRIELGEIESALRQHPMVLDAVVLCREETSGEKQLVAYVLAATNMTPVPHILQNNLQMILPSSMIPAIIMILDTFPLSPNGKINRQALPDPQTIHPDLSHDYVAPRNPLEELLIEIWRDVFKTDRIGVHDNFLHMGGHSLLATHVIARLRNMLQLEIPVRTIFDQPTVEQLAQRLNALLTIAVSDSAPEKTKSNLRVMPTSVDAHQTNGGCEQ